MKYCFGVDIGGTTVKMGLFEETGTILDKWEITTDTSEEGKAILPNVAASIEMKIEEHKLIKDDIIGIGAGVPGGINFIEHVKLTYFIYGAVMTVVPMVAGFLVAKYVFKLSIFNNLGSITGGMTSTPALGTLISTTGTDEVASAYAATYPIALVSVVLLSKLIILL